jgi:hypothetical protein
VRYVSSAAKPDLAMYNNIVRVRSCLECKGRLIEEFLGAFVDTFEDQPVLLCNITAPYTLFCIFCTDHHCPSS